MRTIAALLALAALAVGSASAASAGTEGAATGVALVVAKRLGGNAPSTALAEVELSGVSMRQATVGLGAQRLTAATPFASVMNVSGVPLERAKRL